MRANMTTVDGHLEVWTSAGRELLDLPGPRSTIGSSEAADLVVADGSVSRVHALLEWLGGSWFVQDLGSRNGTFVNGERVQVRRVMRAGDEIRLGRVRLVLRGIASPSGAATMVTDDPPVLTARERDVIITLCRPLLTGDPFTEPATVHEIAAALTVSDAAVKQHLGRLYDKFAVDEGIRRRSRLANVALSTGAVSITDLERG
jgi:pSer/pThr/pTyr-binding forkhead associated (FHA) protein